MQMLIEKRTNNLVYILGVLTAIIFTLNRGVGALPLFLLGIAIMLFALVFFRFDDLFLYTMILFPLYEAIKLASISSAFYGYYFILVAIKYFAGKGFNIKFRFSIFAFFIFVIITSIKYGNYNLIISEVREVVCLLLLFTMFNTNAKYLDRDYIIKILMCSILGATITAASFFLGTRHERNFATLTFPCFVAIILLICTYGKKVSIISIFSMILLAVGSLISSSRTNFIVLMFVVLVPVFLLFDKGKIKHGICFLLLIAMMVFLISILFSEVINSVLQRFDGEDVETGNGRTEIWSFYINLTCSSWDRFLFGNGAYNNYIHLIGHHEHNSFVQAFSQFGILGAFFWVCMYLSLFMQIIKVKGKFKISSIVPILCFVGCNMGVGNMGSMSFVCLFLCCCLVIRYCRGD